MVGCDLRVRVVGCGHTPAHPSAPQRTPRTRKATPAHPHHPHTLAALARGCGGALGWCGGSTPPPSLYARGWGVVWGCAGVGCGLWGAGVRWGRGARGVCRRSERLKLCSTEHPQNGLDPSLNNSQLYLVGHFSLSSAPKHPQRTPISSASVGCAGGVFGGAGVGCAGGVFGGAGVGCGCGVRVWGAGVGCGVWGRGRGRGVG